MEKRRSKGHAVPALDHEPDLYEDLEDVWATFDLLCKTRGHGPNGPLPLQLSEIRVAIATQGFQEGEELQVMELLLAMDSVWLKHTYQKIKRNVEKAPRR